MREARVSEMQFWHSLDWKAGGTPISQGPSTTHMPPVSVRMALLTARMYATWEEDSGGGSGAEMRGRRLTVGGCRVRTQDMCQPPCGWAHRQEGHRTATDLLGQVGVAVLEHEEAPDNLHRRHRGSGGEGNCTSAVTDESKSKCIRMQCSAMGAVCYQREQEGAGGRERETNLRADLQLPTCGARTDMMRVTQKGQTQTQ